MSSRFGRKRGRPPKIHQESIRAFVNGKVVKPKWLQSYKNDDSSLASSSLGSTGSYGEQCTARKHVSVTPFLKRGRKLGSRGNRGGKAYVCDPRRVGTEEKNGTTFSTAGAVGELEDRSHLPDDDLHSMEVDWSGGYPASNVETKSMVDVSSDYPVSERPGVMVRSDGSAPGVCQPQSLHEVPTLELPKSSQDLLLPAHQVLVACAVYKVLVNLSREVRLSPFRLEDFMAALLSQEMTCLLAEIHIQLLRALLREEDLQKTVFGPPDQKDSTSSVLLYSDSLTWPEVLRAYLNSDPVSFAPLLRLLNSCDYPFTTCAVRLEVLKCLTDYFLCTAAARQEMEGGISHDKNCRNCNKQASVALSCVTCPAVYHPQCLEPPSDQLPEGGWQCPVCIVHQCSGVTDCINDADRSTSLYRQQCLGSDRHGRKYWFICRRIVVEEANASDHGRIEDGSSAEESQGVWYYSSPYQFEQLLSRLDKKKHERMLYRKLNSLRPEILRQMSITVSLTNEAKGSKKSFFDVEEEAVKEADQVARDADVTVAVDQENPDGVSDMSVDNESEDSDDDDLIEVPSEPGSTNVTDVLAGASRPATGTDIQERSSEITRDMPRVKSVESDEKPNTSEVVFKLGMEGRYKSYVNQYTTNPLALSKKQLAEELERKRNDAEFQWIGPVYGPQALIVQTLRDTLLHLNSQMMYVLMHVYWVAMRQSWINAVNACVTPADFVRVLTFLVACIRPSAFKRYWNESVGHVRLHRQKPIDRTERENVEKNEKKEKEMEEELCRLHTVHYTKGVKHQVWKQKGEEYRLHGQWGWLWTSAGRSVRHVDSRRCGLRAGPSRIVVYDERKSQFDYIAPKPGTTPYRIPKWDPAMEVVDVSVALRDPHRRVYSKSGKLTPLDLLLGWRLKLIETEQSSVTSSPNEQSTSDSSESTDVYESVDAVIKQEGIGKKWKSQMEKKWMNSGESTEGRVILRRPCGVKKIDRGGGVDKLNSIKLDLPVKHPITSTFVNRKRNRTIFVLADHELQHLARRGGQVHLRGFRSGSKNNPAVWPYPSSRPLFKTCWSYRTSAIQSLCAVALQIRTLWASIRWEDIALSLETTSPSTDANSQSSKDKIIVEKEIVSHRHVGRFSERTEYLQHRKETRFEVYNKICHASSSSSSLRKRKTEEALRESQSVESEEWVDECALDLQDIIRYHEKLERAREAAISDAVAATVAVEVAKDASASSRASSSRSRSKVKCKKDPSKTRETNKSTKVATEKKPKPPVQPQRCSSRLRNAVAVNPTVLTSADTKQEPEKPVEPTKTTVPPPVERVPNCDGFPPKPCRIRIGERLLEIIHGQDGKLQVRGLASTESLVKVGIDKLTRRWKYAIVPNGKNVCAQVASTSTATGRTAGAPASKALRDKNTASPVGFTRKSGNRLQHFDQVKRTSSALAQRRTADKRLCVDYTGQEIQHQGKSQKGKTLSLSRPGVTSAPTTTTGFPGPTTFRPNIFRNFTAPIKDTPNHGGEEVSRSALEGSSISSYPSWPNVSGRGDGMSSLLPGSSSDSEMRSSHRLSEDQAGTSTSCFSESDFIDAERERLIFLCDQYPYGSAPTPALPHVKSELDFVPNASSTPTSFHCSTSTFFEESQTVWSPASFQETDITDYLPVLCAEDLAHLFSSGSGVEYPVKEEPINVTTESGDASFSDGQCGICQNSCAHSRFYVRCSVCSNCFHGECAGIPAIGDVKGDYTCDGCKQFKSEYQNLEEIPFCICRQPYDKTQFYLKCDVCHDWFHGRCVGVLQSESESLGKYFCPTCLPQWPLNYANMKTLSASDYDALRALISQLESHESFSPLRFLVDPRCASDDYDVVKYPMDFCTIRSKIEYGCYQRLVDFIGDIMLIISNCHLYNEKNSSIHQCASALECFIRPLLSQLRESIYKNL